MGQLSSIPGLGLAVCQKVVAILADTDWSLFHAVVLPSCLYLHVVGVSRWGVDRVAMVDGG